ncbi:hypothetical protein VN97_g5001 [Penicillium thymicola]|uniref:Uncharacterized protein n=1 Tax=Penicillium thymicola TaxID=293382 RepID=A0AAI9TJH4_PENTH|nr:hypothetical protein VN97_g5001 [Penicillium thymicola]
MIVEQEKFAVMGYNRVLCGPCSKRTDQGLQCVYTGELEKKRARQTYISKLETRIQQLESPQYSEKGHGSGRTPVDNTAIADTW